MKLKEYVYKNRVNISEMARQIGMSINHLNNIVHGKRIPGPELARRIQEQTHDWVTVDDLIPSKSPATRCHTCGKLWKGVKIACKPTS
jgi:transcriptional regulator with XRE-family HTH domain